MKHLLAVLLLWVASAATATVDAWPALYDVSGVAADDVLNIRETPSASAPIVGALAPNARNVEVIRLNDAETWGLVNAGERSGWVSLAYMQRQPDQWAGRYPQITSCYGTEPFWGLAVEATRTTLSFFGEVAVDAPGMMRLQSSNRLDRFALRAGGITAILLEQSCNDGMSDREFGLSIELVAPVDGNTMQLSGCCTIQP